MMPWQLHELYEVDDESSEPLRQLGGALVGLKIDSVSGPQNEIEILPVEEDQVQPDILQKYVQVKVGGKSVWLDKDETLAVIKLLQIALKAAEENINNATI